MSIVVSVLSEHWAVSHYNEIDNGTTIGPFDCSKHKHINHKQRLDFFVKMLYELRSNNDVTD